MPRYIIKLTDNDVDYFLEWSTIVDAPVTYGMPLEEFQEYYRERYGSEGMRELEQRLERCKAYGTSCYNTTSIAELIKHNRAGVNEIELTLEQIIEQFIRNRPKE